MTQQPIKLAKPTTTGAQLLAEMEQRLVLKQQRAGRPLYELEADKQTLTYYMKAFTKRRYTL